MSVLIIAEHDNATLKPATLHTVTAAQKIGGDIHILVAGQGVDGAAAAAAKVGGVAKVLKADDAAYAHQLAENVAKLIVALAPNSSHVLAAATLNGKNILPRAADLRNLRGRKPGHLRAADLCRQCPGDRAVLGQDQVDHRPRDRLRHCTRR